jgi:hypothetical protein
MSIAVSVLRSGFARWLQGPEIHGTFTDGRSFQTYSPSDPSLIQRLYNKGVSITARPQSDLVRVAVDLLAAVCRPDRRLYFPLAPDARHRQA